jgi:Domain of unknown function (DUF927)
VNYIQTAPVEEQFESVACTGWHGNSFVLLDAVIGPDAHQLIFQSSTEQPDLYRVRGTLDEWRHHVARYCLGNSRLLLAVSSALAGPLMDPLMSTPPVALHRGSKVPPIISFCRVYRKVRSGPLRRRALSNQDLGHITRAWISSHLDPFNLVKHLTTTCFRPELTAFLATSLLWPDSMLRYDRASLPCLFHIDPNGLFSTDGNGWK